MSNVRVVCSELSCMWIDECRRVDNDIQLLNFCLFLIWVRPFLWGKNVVSSSGTFSNIT
jgi:hypothetical protein